jgi:hypothetical protein
LFIFINFFEFNFFNQLKLKLWLFIFFFLIFFISYFYIIILLKLNFKKSHFLEYNFVIKNIILLLIKKILFFINYDEIYDERNLIVLIMGKI